MIQEESEPVRPDRVDGEKMTGRPTAPLGATAEPNEFGMVSPEPASALVIGSAAIEDGQIGLACLCNGL